ncbi:peptidoglycan-binding protein [Tamilnaduibacter salinus]|uniref:Peptidoglycan-binding protein n=1 Tax=Tamilnaduibacter salinus TaxID=1484056 RepID=A0A2A2I602_9GAMM|nr:ExeA family protein [Tamilnaduibacter salinus]PAV27002.1 peptidoglycan-binding protein [Tamilnaduibacter salinus]
MYDDFFGFREPPFSIAPDPRYLYLSERHKEALAHLLYGVQGQGGFIVITGEVGTGKTTVCRGFLGNVPDHVDIALILNPRLSAPELLSGICREFGIEHAADSTIRDLIDAINEHLLSAHAEGRHPVLIIDEAQNLSADVLEQLRLLTNLETAEKKLLQIVLLGQPELRDMLGRQELRQLSQRVTARYHLAAISREELPSYVRYRLRVAGQRSEFFSDRALKVVYRLSGGIPRLINLICDRALLGAYAEGVHEVEAHHVRQAGREVLDAPGGSSTALRRVGPLVAGIALVAVLTTSLFGYLGESMLSAAEPEGQAAAGSSRVLSGTVERVEPPIPALEIAESPTPESQSTEASNSGPPVADSQPERPERSLPDWIQSLPDDATSRGTAYQTLLAEWDLDYQQNRDGSACRHAEASGLSCLHQQGNWGRIRRLDRPVVLRVFTDDGRTHHLTATAMTQDTVRLRAGSRQQTLPLDAVEAVWLGDFTVIWRMPPYKADRADGAGPSREAWLTASLMELIAGKAPGDEADRLMGASMEEQVSWYQQQAGLVPDGIPGTRTLIRMNSDLGRNVPRLSPGGQG